MANTGVSFAPAVLTPEPGRSELAVDTTVITVDLANGTRLKIGAQASPTLVTAALQALR